MKRIYFQPEVLVASLATISFICASPAAPTNPDALNIEGGMDPGDAL